MNLHWEKTVITTGSRHDVYCYLADFSLHPEWVQGISRMQQVEAGDDTGIGARFITWEAHTFDGASPWKRRMYRLAPSRTMCEVTDLTPESAIAWRAHLMPRIFGNARLSFHLEESEAGTLLTQQVDEHYSVPVAWIMRYAMGITEEGIAAILDQSLTHLQAHLDVRFPSSVLASELPS